MILEMLDSAAFYIILSGIIVAVIFQSAFFIRFKFKKDISAILILLVYLAVFIARAFFYKTEYSGIGNVQRICVCLILLVSQIFP
jgi:membrane protein implicated in regulation of membrane protease activity